jgi:hypothetical protein
VRTLHRLTQEMPHTPATAPVLHVQPTRDQLTAASRTSSSLRCPAPTPVAALDGKLNGATAKANQIIQSAPVMPPSPHSGLRR